LSPSPCGIFDVYAIFAGTVRDRLISRPRALAWMRGVFGGAVVALAVKLAPTSR
jgi:threonine/homoserine/homoserine lactone efflux protein